MRFCGYEALALLLIASTTQQLTAKAKRGKADSTDQDRISVAAHLAVSGGPIVAFAVTSHYGRSYVYAQRAPDQPITLLEITDPGQPTIVSQIDPARIPSSGTNGRNLVAVAGTAAISTSAPSEAVKPEEQTIRLLDFSDPANPKVTRQFDKVTAVRRISGRVTLIANPEGIWVLTSHLAEDPADAERYARKVVYGESMY
jgi:hypothetical protein